MHSKIVTVQKFSRVAVGYRYHVTELSMLAEDMKPDSKPFLPTHCLQVTKA